MLTINIEKKVKVIAEYDTVVCGAGPAGWIAAVSSARAGKKTALIERYGFIGGTATAGYVVPISGFFFKEKRVVGGIAWEFVNELEKLDAAFVEYPKGHVSVNPEYYKLVARRMLIDAGVELYTNTYLTDCIKENNRVTHIIINSKNGDEAIAGKCFIDATGDGDLFARAGAPMLEKTNELQPMSLCFVVTNVDTTTELLKNCIHHDGKHGNSINTVIHNRLVEIGKIRPVPQFGGPWFNVLLKGNSLAVNITRAEADATDREAYTKAEGKLHADMIAIMDILKAEFPEFKDAEIVVSAFNAGVRETRNIKGVYTLTNEDFAKGIEYECPVAHCAHPMDIHKAKNDDQVLIYLDKNSYVPYETMVSYSLDNVIAAGRCISAESDPYASLRVQATLMSMGECAGLAAALACKCELPVYSLPIKRLKEKIDERGCVL
ncbi:MAG: FAD-dependent oxidoreductase [Eubacteriales bacterium]